jgi:hypothetical protein
MKGCLLRQPHGAFVYHCAHTSMHTQLVCLHFHVQEEQQKNKGPEIPP